MKRFNNIWLKMMFALGLVFALAVMATGAVTLYRWFMWAWF